MPGESSSAAARASGGGGPASIEEVVASDTGRKRETLAVRNECTGLAAGVVPGASRRVSTPSSEIPEGARSDGSASTSCCVIRGAGISVHGTAVTDRRWNRPIVDARAKEFASGARLPGVRTTTAGGRYHGCG